MKLDPELGIFKQFTMPDYGNVTAVRAWLHAMSAYAVRDPAAAAGLTIADHKIPGPAAAPDLSVRIYRPENSEPVPALVYFHGGSLIMGDLSTDEAACLRYAREAACAVVSVDYRLAPEHRFPAAAEDGYAALLWAARHSAPFGIDPTRVALGGSSAGGTLAAAVALMARDARAVRPALQLLVYPALDDRMTTPSILYPFQPRPLPTSVIGHMWRYYLGGAGVANSPYAAPARATDFTDLAPAYLEVGALDPLRDEGIAYATRLLQAGVPTDLHVLAGAPHAFDMVLEAEITRRAYAYRIAALRKAFVTPI